MKPLIARAPGKLNLCLHLGPARADGLHELASLFESVTLADTLLARQADGLDDRVICPEVAGENLAQTALRSAREVGLLDGPPLEVELTKRVPVAAGMGGGSGDAAAALRIAASISGLPIERYERIAFALGADVPSQLTPGASLVFGAGERITPVDPDRLAGAASRAYVIIEQSQGLSTAEVFRQCDRAGLPEPAIVQREEELLKAVTAGLDLAGLAGLIENAFTPAIVALRPELEPLPALLGQHGALASAFTGSGPTCFGLFASAQDAETAASQLGDAGHSVHVALPAGADFAAAREVEAREVEADA